MKYWEYEDDKIILFWGGVLSNWYKSDFICDNTQFNCVEQYMMRKKAIVFGDYDAAKKVMSTKDPRKQKAIGRTVRNFDGDVWLEKCREEVYPGIRAKFTQNDKLGDLLRGTGAKVIAEASPYDKIWGIGLSTNDKRAQNQSFWQGLNILGELLMKARKDI